MNRQPTLWSVVYSPDGQRWTALAPMPKAAAIRFHAALAARGCRAEVRDADMVHTAAANSRPAQVAA